MHLTSQCIREEISKEIQREQAGHSDMEVGISPSHTPPGHRADETTRLTPMRGTSTKSPVVDEAGIADAIAGASAAPRQVIVESSDGSHHAIPGLEEQGEGPTPRAAAEAILEKESWPAWNYHTEDFSEVRRVFGIDDEAYLKAFPTSEEVCQLTPTLTPSQPCFTLFS